MYQFSLLPGLLGLGVVERKLFNCEQTIIIIIIIIITICSSSNGPCEFFTPALADSLSLESKWQQVS